MSSLVRGQSYNEPLDNSFDSRPHIEINLFSLEIVC